MNYQFPLFQSLCIFLIASSAYGEQLPRNVRLQYAYCFELKKLSCDELSSFLQDSYIDNLCVDSYGHFHFLSSAQGGTTVYLSAAKSDITVVILDYITLGIKLDWLGCTDVSLLVHFHEPEHALHVYKDIYHERTLTRENFVIGCIQKLFLDRDTGNHLVQRSVLTQQAALYTELYRSAPRLIFTLKGVGANGEVGDPVLILVAKAFNISEVLVNNNVVLRYRRNVPLYHVLTFPDFSKATNFCNIVRGFVVENLPVLIPPAVQEVLESTRV